MFGRLLSLLLRNALVILLLGGTALILLLMTMRFGLISGEEFAADTFERRSYWYYELPLVRLKITPVFRDVRRPPCEAALIQKKLITPKKPPTRWDLVAALRGAEPWRQGDAQILCQYLDAWNSEQSVPYWEAWTTDHAKLAKIVWPEIAQLARQDHYVLIPVVFDAALAAGQPRSLRKKLDAILSGELDRLAATEMELGDWESAVRLYDQALQYQPDRSSSLQGRSACYARLGRPVPPALPAPLPAELPAEKEP